MNDKKDIKFTGDPVAFDGVEGKRDPKTGKGRFDLIPTEVYYPLFSKADHDWLLDCHPASILMAIAHERFIEAIIKMTIYSYAMHNEHYAASSSEFWHGVWPMLQDLAIHFQKGAEHYGERNCQKGIPLWSFKDSAMRHATQVFEGKTDEPHSISVIWNCWMAQWTVITSDKKDDTDEFNPFGMTLKIIRDRRKTAKEKLFDTSSDSPKVEDKKNDIDEMKKFINALSQLANELNTPVVTAQQTSYTREEVEAIKQEQRDKLKKFCIRMRDKMMKLNFEFGGGKDKWDKLIDEMAENAKEAGIPWLPKEPEIIPDARDDHSRTVVSDSLEVEAIKKEAAEKAIEDFLNDRSPENVDRIIKEIGAQRIIESLKTIPLNERRLFDTQFADLLNTPEGKDRARWFYGPDELLTDLIDRVENKRGYGRDYRDYVPLLIKLNRAFEEYLQEKNRK